MMRRTRLSAAVHQQFVKFIFTVLHIVLRASASPYRAASTELRPGLICDCRGVCSIHITERMNACDYEFGCEATLPRVLYSRTTPARNSDVEEQPRTEPRPPAAGALPAVDPLPPVRGLVLVDDATLRPLITPKRCYQLSEKGKKEFTDELRQQHAMGLCPVTFAADIVKAEEFFSQAERFFSARFGYAF
jgi:hypothetical protein